MAEDQKPAATVPAEEKEARTNKHPKAYQWTERCTEDEFNHVAAIADARIAAGISKTRGHFIRQCIDFAINYNHVQGERSFAVPEDVAPKLLNNGYYHIHIKTIELCK